MKPLPKLKKPSCIGPECTGCSAEKCYSHGGEIDDPGADIDREEQKIKAWNANKEENEKKLKEKAAENAAHFKKRKPFDQGGDVDVDDEMDDMDMDDEKPMGERDLESELDQALAGELEKAFESKNKKEILEVIRAIVLSCKE